MAGLVELEQQFRGLHTAAVTKYENRVMARREQLEAWVQGHPGLEQQKLDAAMRAAGLDAQRVDSDARQDEAFVKKNLLDIRSTLTDRVPLTSSDVKRLALQAGYGAQGVRVIPPYATILMAGDRSDLAHVSGEHGNPWVMPYQPGYIKLKQERWGGGAGLCGWAQPYLARQTAAIWFAFLADTTALWFLTPAVDFHGFYYLAANKDWWNCKDSRVTLDVWVDAYQYYWNGQKHFSLLNEDEDGGIRYSFYDNGELFDYSALLRADAAYYVFVLVWIEMLAHPYGGGTHCEINFQDGAANYINPLVLLAGHY